MTPLCKETARFVIAEIEMVHALCDRVQIPREHLGELLSMAQRVNAMESLLTRLLQDTGRVNPTVFH